MTDRINFLEKGGFILNYRNMVVVLIVCLVICGIVEGLLVVRQTWIAGKLDVAKKTLVELNARKDEALQRLQLAKAREEQAVSAETLKSQFEIVPDWSKVMEDFVTAVPTQVWLADLKTSDSTLITGAKHIELEGKSLSSSSIARFMNGLERSPFFDQVVMSRSNRDPNSGIVTFVLSGEVMFE